MREVRCVEGTGFLYQIIIFMIECQSWSVQLCPKKCFDFMPFSCLRDRKHGGNRAASSANLFLIQKNDGARTVL